MSVTVNKMAENQKIAIVKVFKIISEFIKLLLSKKNNDTNPLFMGHPVLTFQNIITKIFLSLTISLISLILLYMNHGCRPVSSLLTVLTGQAQ